MLNTGALAESGPGLAQATDLFVTWALALLGVAALAGAIADWIRLYRALAGPGDDRA